MKKFYDIFFSMKFAGILMLLFAAVIGIATFIENDLGTQAARIMVYNTKWFEVLLLIISISLLGSVFRYRLVQRKKFSLLVFHLAFMLIAVVSIMAYLNYRKLLVQKMPKN
ncbi:MAG TPA: hypothetical protein VK994_05605 [Bacteroidales bacterium]|nr:hypothetical protein [Bacteroidales bacterium]